MRAVPGVPAGAVLCVLWCLSGCSSAGVPDVSDLAIEPPLPYSVLVTGGVFVEPGPGPEYDAPLRRTFRPDGPNQEVLSLDVATEVLEAARAFVVVQEDREWPPGRRAVAASQGTGGGGDPGLQALLREARESGHDFLLVLEGIDDGRVEYKGINDQWPITLAAWLLVGLGMLIPDHTYESHAVLNAALRDVQTGAPVMQFQVSAGPFDLPLVQRTDFWGILLSIIVPPFWVGDDDEDVEGRARELITGRLVASMVREIKSADTRAGLRERLPGTPGVEVIDGAWLVRVDAQENLSFLRLRLDGEPLRGAAFEAFERELLASRRLERGHVLYAARYASPPAGSRLQVLLQTVTGRVASATIPLTP